MRIFPIPCIDYYIGYFTRGGTHLMVVYIDVLAFWGAFSGILVYQWVGFHRRQKCPKFHEFGEFLKKCVKSTQFGQNLIFLIEI